MMLGGVGTVLCLVLLLAGTQLRYCLAGEMGLKVKVYIIIIIVNLQ